MKKSLFVLLVLVLVLSLAACGGSSDSGSAADETASVVGTWVNDDDGGTLSLGADGAFTMVVPGKGQIDATYEYDGSKLNVMADGTFVLAYAVKFDGGKLILTMDDGTYTVWSKQ